MRSVFPARIPHISIPTDGIITPIMKQPSSLAKKTWCRYNESSREVWVFLRGRRPGISSLTSLSGPACSSYGASRGPTRLCLLRQGKKDSSLRAAQDFSFQGPLTLPLRRSRPEGARSRKALAWEHASL